MAKLRRGRSSVQAISMPTYGPFLPSKASCLSRSSEIQFDDLAPPIPVPAPPVLTVLPAPLPTTLPAISNLNIVRTPYKELDWNNGFRFIVGAPISESPPNAAIFDGVTQELNAARISTYDKVQSFTLKSLYVAGFLESEGAALVYVPITLITTGTKTNGETVSKDFNYTPKGLKQFVLPNSFTDLKSVDFESDLLTTLLAAVAIDDVEYTVYKPC